jgi:uncharacterized protein (TIGR02757 family)
MKVRITREVLEDLYQRYNDRRYAHPDPVEFLYWYNDAADREVAGLVAACLSYGNVTSILNSVRRVLGALGPSPARLLRESDRSDLTASLAGFRHRWTSAEEVVSFLWGIRGVLAETGSLYGCFMEGLAADDETVLPALSHLVAAVGCPSGTPHPASLLPVPSRGAACKRLHLYLRWMVRRDNVDPGDWAGVGAHRLVVPVDTHMHRIGLALNLTRRRQAGQRAALEMTAAFRRFCPEDPVRYDFALTRLGIRPEADLAGFLRTVSGKRRAA